MGSGVQEGDKRHQAFLHRTTAFKAVVLVFVLLLSASIISLTDSYGTHSNHVGGDRARTAAIDPSTVTLVASPVTAFVNDTITFYANASSDDPGAILTFTIFYDCLDPTPTPNPESPVTVDTTGYLGSLVRTFAYNHPGNLTQGGHQYFWVGVFVSDGTDNYSAVTQVFVDPPPPPPVNEPPFFIWLPDENLQPTSGVAKNIVIKVADNNSDTVTVHWDFGDGTDAINVTVAPPGGVVLSQTHTWNPRIPGGGGISGDYFLNYTLNVTLSDGLHPSDNSTTIVAVKVLANGPPTIFNAEVKASKTSASPLEPINFTIAASDPEGDPLTWTFNYSDGTVEVYHTGFTANGLLVRENTTHSFATVGNYAVKVGVSDALVPFQVGAHNVSVATTIYVTSNVAPYFDPIGVNPGAPMINATIGYVNVTLSVEALDADGDIFNLTWDLGVFGTRTNVSVGGTQPFRYVQVLKFNDTGSYPVTVTATDGRPGHERQRSVIVNVSSNNLPPSVLVFTHDPYSLGDFAAANESVRFRVVVTDREHDALNLTWDFGDGSPKQYMSLTNYDTNGNITVSVNHTYVLKGFYNVTLITTDNKMGFFNHTVTSHLKIQVSFARVVQSDDWNWWDYASLALFMMIPISAIAWYVALRRQRQHIEDQGMTVDEWKLLKEINSKGLNK